MLGSPRAKVELMTYTIKLLGLPTLCIPATQSQLVIRRRVFSQEAGQQRDESASAGRFCTKDAAWSHHDYSLNVLDLF